jgi:RimJ/RimL family protein N-acetyltransferase
VPAIPLPEPPLTDDEIVLRPWSWDDVPALTAACQDPEIPRWTVVPSQYTEDHAREFIMASEADRTAGRQLSLAIVGRDGGLLGAIGLASVDRHQRNGEIGYWIAREARRRSVGTRAVRLLSRWALTELELERIELLANPLNEASQRLAERAGFTREGLLRKYRRRRGEREDLVMFSLLAEEVE